MKTIDHVWAGTSSVPTSSSSLWLSTLVDILNQWGWLVGVIALSSLVTLAYGERRPDKDH